MRVGIVLPIASEDLPKDRPAYPFVRDVALAAEGAGLDSVWVFDHLLFRSNGGTPGHHGVLDGPCGHRRGDEPRRARDARDVHRFPQRGTARQDGRHAR